LRKVLSATRTKEEYKEKLRAGITEETILGTTLRVFFGEGLEMASKREY